GGRNDETLPDVMANGTQWNEAISDIWRLLPGGRNDETLPDVMANGTQWSEAISKFFVRTLSGEYGEQPAQALQGYFEQELAQPDIALEWYGGRGNPSLGGVPHTQSPQVGGASVPLSPSVPQSEETVIHYLTNQLIHRIGEEPQILLDLLSFYQRPEGVDPLEYPNLNPHDPDVINLLNSYQWHLRSDENPDADANISQVNQQENLQGRDVVIGVIDNGFEVTDTERSLVGHADLSANYREDLSYDFDEEDSIPSRVVSSEAVYQGENRTLGDWGANSMFGFRSPHSGLIQNATLNLDIEYESVEDLEIYLYWHEKSETSPLPVEKRLKIKSIGEDLTEVDLTSHLRGQPASTLWGLEIIDTNYVFGKTGTLNDWSFDLDTVNAHGTAVVGVSSGDANNDLGVNGVAGSSGWAGLRVGGNGATDNEMQRALSYQNNEIDIYNNSWGLGFFKSPFPDSLDELELGTKQGRNGLGNIYVFAGANAGQAGGNVNYNAFANSRHTIAVAAIDHEGKQAVYSEPGAPLLVSAYSDNGTSEDYVGITTTAPYQDDGDDTNDYIRGGFGGTSSAAPVVSGVVALMLEANPNLTARDVQHILVETAQKNDPNDEDWIRNGAGYWVNHKYGFGAVDAQAAVERAKIWILESVAEEVMISQGKVVNEPIEDNSELSSTLTFDSSNQMNVEWVEVEFNADHEYKGDLEIVLEHRYINNFGEEVVTESVLSEQHFNGRYLGDDDSHNWRFTSARHWWEPSRGEWKLRVNDEYVGHDSEDNQWHNWKLNVYGNPKSFDKVLSEIYLDQGNNEIGIYGQGYDMSNLAIGEEFKIVSHAQSVDTDFYGNIKTDLHDVSVTKLVDGGFVVIWGHWESNSDDRSPFPPPYLRLIADIYGQRYDRYGIPSGDIFQVNSYTQSVQWKPSVASLTDGGFVVAWGSQNSTRENSYFGVQARRYDSKGIPIGEEFQVNYDTYYDENYLSLIGLTNGGFIISWNTEDRNGVDQGTYGKLYDYNGLPVSPEFPVNWYSQNNQDLEYPASWYPQNNQDGSNWILYGQRYDRNGVPILALEN
ncbi:S8 family serine peptidase, partial [Roseofilum capinflatum]